MVIERVRERESGHRESERERVVIERERVVREREREHCHHSTV